MSQKMENKEDVSRVEPLKAGADGQDLAQSDNEAVVTAAERTEEKPLTAQRERAVAALSRFGIGPNYTLSHTEAVNAMQLFARDELRAASAGVPARRAPQQEPTP